MKQVHKKSILIVTECFYPEEFKINEVAIYWKKLGYDVGVLTMSPSYPFGKIYKGFSNKLYQKDEYKGIEIYRVFATTGYAESDFKKILKYINFMILGSILSLFVGKKYNYVFGYNLGALTDMVPAVIIKKLYKKPLMIWVQDIWPDSIYAYGFKKTRTRSRILNYFVKFIYSNATNIGISGKGFKSRLKLYAQNHQKFEYLPNWADIINHETEGVKLSNLKKVHFTFAGNIGKVQNLENIINAFKSLSKNYLNKSQLNIIGDGSNLNDLKNLSRGIGSIVFHGKVERKHMSSYYASSDFLIVSLVDLPIFEVTVPAKVQTYIAAKKPIFAAIKGDSADIVVQNKLGISVDPSDIVLIRKAMEKCINMPEDEKAKFTVNSEKISNSIFNKEFILEQLTKTLINN